MCTDVCVQLFTKMGCDETEILEHTQELLKELGPEQAEMEGEEGEGEGEEEREEDGLEDSDSELVGGETENMEVS